MSHAATPCHQETKALSRQPRIPERQGKPEPETILSRSFCYKGGMVPNLLGIVKAMRRVKTKRRTVGRSLFSFMMMTNDPDVTRQRF